jgi:hypothetical protein
VLSAVVGAAQNKGEAMNKRVKYGCVLTMLLAFGCSDAATDESATTGKTSQAATVTTTTTTLVAIEDARTQAGSPDVNFGGGFLWTATLGHHVFMKFDLSALPAGAVIESAQLVMNYTGNYDGENTVELGRVEGPWDESTVTWTTQPPVTWGGPTQTLGDDPVEAVFDLGGYLNDIGDGEVSFALHSEVPGHKQFYSRESDPALAPRLVVTYRVPPLVPAPDLGDAPDSTNHHGANNTAYPGRGVLGQFPTVFNLPAGMVRGPRFENQTLEGFLGLSISRELDADAGPDQDGRNNILRLANGAIVDVANRDRADDGWLNPSTAFFNCVKRRLRVRVNRPVGATLPVMYLNGHFDGTGDGDWNDVVPCPIAGGGAQPGFEWIIQNQPINMGAIAPGSFVDIDVVTERVANPTSGLPHWMRFTLSEQPAPQPGGMLNDGRGPLTGYARGEAEDYLQKPPPVADFGDLSLSKTVSTRGQAEPIANFSLVDYTLRLRHDNGDEDVPAKLSDELPEGVFPLSLDPSLIEIDTAGGARTGMLTWHVEPPSGGQVYPRFRLEWHGAMSADSQVTLKFPAHIVALCSPILSEKRLSNVAEAESPVHPPVSASADLRVDCPTDVVAEPIDPSAMFPELFR